MPGFVQAMFGTLFTFRFLRGTASFVDWLSFRSDSLPEFSRFALACHVPKTYAHNCPDHIMAKIHSRRSSILTVNFVKMVAVRAVERGNFGRFP